MKFEKDVIWDGEIGFWKQKIESNWPFIQRYYYDKYLAVAEAQPEVIAEIGVRAGYGAYAMRQGNPKAYYYGYDNGSENPDAKEHALHLIGGASKVDYAIDTLTVATLGVNADFVHVDGCHQYQYVTHDLDLAVATGARWVLVDDTHLRDVSRAFEKWTAEARPVSITVHEYQQFGMATKQALVKLR